MRALLYLAIWASMIALGSSEWARRSRGQRSRRPTFLLSAAGLTLLVTHIAIAIFHHHGGDHAAAVAETARLTESVYGLAWGGGVYVNYAFAIAWAAYLWWWSRDIGLVIDARRRSVLAVRFLLFVLIFNAVVVFASPLTRPLGVVVCAVLAWAWRPTAARQELATSRSSSTSTLRSRS